MSFGTMKFIEYPTYEYGNSDEDFATYVRTRYHNESKEWQNLIISGWPNVLVMAHLDPDYDIEYSIYCDNGKVAKGDTVEIIGDWVHLRWVNLPAHMKTADNAEQHRCFTIHLREIKQVMETKIISDISFLGA